MTNPAKRVLVHGQGPDQPGNPHSLLRAFAGWIKSVHVLSQSNVIHVTGQVDLSPNCSHMPSFKQSC